jgi:hypothetical protein
MLVMRKRVNQALKLLGGAFFGVLAWMGQVGPDEAVSNLSKWWAKVFGKAPDWMLLLHLDSGQQKFLVALAIGFLLWFSWPLISAIRSKYQKPSSPEADTTNRLISLHEAAREAYQNLRASKSAYAYLAEKQAKGKSPEVILDWIATYLREDVHIWGKPPLCNDLELITNAGPPFYFMKGGAKYLQKGGQIAFTELSVKESDWKLAVEKLKGLKADTPL